MTALLTRLASSILPGGVVNELRRLRSLDRDARGIYLWRLARRARSAPSQRPPALNGAQQLLFVCHGNIMRSALAAALVRRALRAWEDASVDVRSAGLHAIPDSPADPRMVRAALRVGLSLDDHRATLISESHVADADIVFVMDYLNEAEIRARFPAYVDKVRLLGAAAPSIEHGDEIPDPFTEGDEAVDACVARIQTAITTLMSTSRLARPKPPMSGASLSASTEST